MTTWWVTLRTLTLQLVMYPNSWHGLHYGLTVLRPFSPQSMDWSLFRAWPWSMVLANGVDGSLFDPRQFYFIIYVLLVITYLITTRESVSRKSQRLLFELRQPDQTKVERWTVDLSTLLLGACDLLVPHWRKRHVAFAVFFFQVSAVGTLFLSLTPFSNLQEFYSWFRVIAYI